jgi:lipopolysaccharide/colanic/teichoic acid biosynthesis glycosyltransferase
LNQLSTVMFHKTIKYLFDFTASLLGLIILAPIFLVIALLISVKLGFPVFFTQVRPGQYSRPFKMIKFRTMTDARDSQGNLLPNEQRMTTLGNFLRATSLDELPELINVLKGDMSLVGPRPLLMDYLPLYNDHQKRRHKVRPGITGWAQVNGRNAISWDEKFIYDVWYVDNQSLILDLKILWLTLVKVFRKEGINARDGEFAKPFRGSVKI